MRRPVLDSGLDHCVLPLTGGPVSPWLVTVGAVAIAVGIVLVSLRARGRERGSVNAALLIVAALVIGTGGWADAPAAHAADAPCRTAPATTPTASPTPMPVASATPPPTPARAVDLTVAIDVPQGPFDADVPVRLTGHVRVQNLSADTASRTGVTVRISRVDGASDWAIGATPGWSLDTTSDPDAIVLVLADPIAAGDTAIGEVTFTYVRPTADTVRFRAQLDEGTGDDDDPANNTALSNPVWTQVAIELP